MSVISSLISILVIGAFLKNTIHDRKRIDGYILENQKLRDELWGLNTGHKVRLPYQKHELKEITLFSTTWGTNPEHAETELKRRIGEEFLKVADIEIEAVGFYDDDLPADFKAKSTIFLEV